MEIRPKQSPRSIFILRLGFGVGFFCSLFGLEGEAELVDALLAEILLPSQVSSAWLGIGPCKDTSHGQQYLLQVLMKYFIYGFRWNLSLEPELQSLPTPFLF